MKHHCITVSELTSCLGIGGEGFKGTLHPQNNNLSCLIRNKSFFSRMSTENGYHIDLLIDWEPHATTAELIKTSVNKLLLTTCAV